MGAFPYIWLLFNTTIGRVILVLLAIYVIIYVFKWWSLLIVAIILIPFAYLCMWRMEILES